MKSFNQWVQENYSEDESSSFFMNKAAFENLKKNHGVHIDVRADRRVQTLGNDKIRISKIKSDGRETLTHDEFERKYVK